MYQKTLFYICPVTVKLCTCSFFLSTFSYVYTVYGDPVSIFDKCIKHTFYSKQNRFMYSASMRQWQQMEYRIEWKQQQGEKHPSIQMKGCHPSSENTFSYSLMCFFSLLMMPANILFINMIHDGESYTFMVLKCFIDRLIAEHWHWHRHRHRHGMKRRNESRQ